MKRLIFLFLWFLCLGQLTQAGVSWSGDVDPTDPATWTSSTSGYIGKTGYGTMDITSDSDVVCQSGNIGDESGSIGVVMVDGAGSTLTSTYDLNVGRMGSGTLNITDSGEVVVGRNTWISQYSNTSDILHFDNGTLTTDGLGCGVDNLTGTGTINTHGLVSDVNMVFDATHGLNQILNINVNPSQNITLILNVNGSGIMGAGYSDIGTMSISDGKDIASKYGYIGWKSGSEGEVTVHGAGSTWTNTWDLTVGGKGNGTLNIMAGGAVSNMYGKIGWLSGGIGNVTVDGTGSMWINDNYLYIGYEGDGVLNLTNHSEVSNGTGYIGGSSVSVGEVMVDTGSTWMNSEDLYVGYDGSGTMNISNGGMVSNTLSGFIGNNSGSTGEVTVDGTGSTWTNSEDLYIGRYGSSSGVLNVTNGGAVSNRTGYIGDYTDSMGVVTVDGVGSTWTNSEDLYIGGEFTPVGSANGTLAITNGGEVSNNYSCIGDESGSVGVVTVDGIGSMWTNTEGLCVGRQGNGVMNISNGGVVSSASGIFDSSVGRLGEVLVDGNDSTWTMNSLGFSVSGMLNVRGGGAVINNNTLNDCRIEGISTSTSVVTVDGPNSTWDIHGGDFLPGEYVNSRLYIGNNGMLNITNGGEVISEYVYIEGDSGETGEVMVDGAGSAWTNSDDLYVGRFSSGILNIINGGEASNNNGYITSSYDLTSKVLVDGASSIWENLGNLDVGQNGDGTLNIYSNGMVSVAGILSINAGTEFNFDTFEMQEWNGFINMASGGMLALIGEANSSLVAFLVLIDGTDAIQYWDDSILNWADITGATMGIDYTLEYITEGNLAGYTMLTVLADGPPDPDIYQDGKVNLKDFGVLASEWLEVGCGNPDWCNRADIDHSEDVGITDLKVLTEYWLGGVE